MDSIFRFLENIKESLSSLLRGERVSTRRGTPADRRTHIASRARMDRDRPDSSRSHQDIAAKYTGEPAQTVSAGQTANDQHGNQAQQHADVPLKADFTQSTDAVQDAGITRQAGKEPQGYTIDARARSSRSFYTTAPAKKPAEQSNEAGLHQSGVSQDFNQSLVEKEAPPVKKDIPDEFANTQGWKKDIQNPGQTYFVDRLKRRWAQMAGDREVAAQAHERAGAMVKKPFALFKRRTKPANAILGVAFTTLQLIVFLVLVLGIAGVGAVIGIAKAYVDTTPVLDVGKIQNQDLTSFIYDGDGNLITTFAGLENRVWATIDEIPQQMQDAIIAIEDSRFLTHDGVDIKRIVGSFLSNMNSDKAQGGSTITQQLIKNTMITNERTYKRKIQEAYLAMQLDAQYEKPQILEAYLNTIPLGQSNYGIKAAAQDYFGKTLDKLTLRECAMLAGLAQSPYLYDPRRNTYTRDGMHITDKRTNTVLTRMYEQGKITKEQYDAALVEKVNILKDSTQSQMYDMPYFVEYAIEDVIRHMLKSRNREDTSENRSRIDAELRTGGYKIYLTVDPQIQKTVENTLYTWKKYPKMQLSRDSSINVRDGSSGFAQIPQPQAAAVVLDYHTGQLKAIVGGRQQPKTKRTLNRAWQAYMPVGSCIKPLAVYAPAIEKGLSPASIIYNVPAPIKGWKNSAGVDGYPSNYSGTSFTGPISMREGLRNSYNIVAAHLLLDTVGIEDSYNTLMKLGIKQTSRNNIKKDGSGLALGTSGITLVEMTAAFGAFGNKGEYIEPLSFTKVLNAKGGVVLDAEQVRTRTPVFKPSTAWLMVNMMTDVITKGTGTRAKIKNMTVAGKTGTNSDYRGVSFNALTPYYSAAVWVGSDAYAKLYKGATGGVDAAPIWQSFMAKIHTDKELKNKAIIDDTPASLGLVKATVCGVSGQLVTDACQFETKYKTVTDWFLKGSVPSALCNMHYQMKKCKVSGKIATSLCPLEQVEEGSVLLVPPVSIIRSMKPEDILKYFPTALLDFPGVDDITSFNPDNPEYAMYFCPIHTQEWVGIQPQYAELVSMSNQLIKDVRAKMDSYWVSQSVKDTLNTKIKAMQDVIAKGFIDPLVTPVTVYNNLVIAYNDLRSYADTVLVEPTPTPTPEPTWEPTPTPTLEPTPTPTPEP